jgi:hypothetical protein
MPMKGQDKQDLLKGRTNTASTRPLDPAWVTNPDEQHTDTGEAWQSRTHRQDVPVK